MDVFVDYMSVILRGFRYQFSIYGYTLSFWHIFLFTLFGGIVIGFLGDLLHLK